MAFIEPLALETWFINVFSGSGEYFTALAIFAILALSGYFRMNGLTAGFMVMVFILLFSGYVPASIVILLAIIGGLLVGIVLPRIVSR